jgi:A/G-specific adenine glycosylase
VSTSPKAAAAGHADVPKPSPALQRVFWKRLVAWQESHGRSGLPWQGTRDPYRVWLSEIMLQQTQVTTVLDYYPRFLERFPDVKSLADASQDDVLALWSGLGYYSRARNLHRCAQAVVQIHEGYFPSTQDVLQTLPGVGRSTAAAIAAFCFDERVAILDANVRRVATRVLGFADDLAVASSERVLWNKASALLPGVAHAAAMPQYTQALMDLGATVCLPRKPACLVCPVSDLCAARKEGQPEGYPVKSRKLKRSAQSLWLLWARRKDGAVWLVRRPGSGIWAGLYCLPVFDSAEELAAAVPARQVHRLQEYPAFKHVLTHKDLHLHPVQWTATSRVRPLGPGAWFAATEWPGVGLPAPVRKLLATA